MPKDGFKAITVSQKTWKKLTKRAKAEELSLPQLIQQYMRNAHDINELQWLDQPQRISHRIDEITTGISNVIVSRRIKERARKWILEKGENPDPYTFDESRALRDEANEIAREIAVAVIEKDKEIYQQFKMQEAVRKLPSLKARKEQLENELAGITKRIEGIEEIQKSIEGNEENES